MFNKPIVVRRHFSPNLLPMEVTWMHGICMDAQNLHGRMVFAWMHGICMDARNLHGRMEFAWPQH